MFRISSLFSRKQTTIGSAATVLVAMVFISRVLGLVRDRLLAARFTPDELGVYFAAFRLPNLVFELLVMGAFTAAFVPVFTKYLTQGKTREAHFMASTIINVSMCVLVVLALPVLVWTEAISARLAPGFSPSQVQVMAQFTRFMIVFQVAPLLIGNFLTGMLQSHNLFLMPAIAPVLYNVGIIGGILFFSTSLGLWAPVVGVGIGAVLFLLVHLPILKIIGYRHAWTVDIHESGVREVGKLMGPRTLGLAVSQIDTTVDLVLASLLGARMVTIFHFAQHLQQFPVGLFGMTVAQAALPLLSAQGAGEDIEEFKKTIQRALHQVLFFVLPISALFIVLRIPVVRLVFGAARFDWQATVLTGMTLSAFSVSLFAQSISQVMARGFYALYDSKTPVTIGVISVLLNTILSVIFIRVFLLPVWALALSTSIASILNAIILFVVLDRRVKHFVRLEFLLPPIKMAVAAAVMGIALYIPLKLLDQLVFDTTRTFGLVLLTGVSGTFGIVTYAFLSWVLGVGEVRSFINLLKRVGKLRGLLFEPAREVVNDGIQN